MRPRLVLSLLLVAIVGVLGERPAVVVITSAHPAAASATPTPDWLPADKQGFGSSHTLANKVWFTLEGPVAPGVQRHSTGR